MPVKFGLQIRHPCSQQTKIPRPVALPKTRLFENQESPAFNPILETSSDPTNVIRGCKMVEIFACTTLFEKTVPPAFAIDKAALVRLSRCGDSCRHEIDDNNRSKNHIRAFQPVPRKSASQQSIKSRLLASHHQLPTNLTSVCSVPVPEHWFACRLPWLSSRWITAAFELCRFHSARDASMAST